MTRLARCLAVFFTGPVSAVALGSDWLAGALEG